MARILLIVKYTFYTGLVLTAGFGIQHLTGIDRSWVVSDALHAEDFFNYNASAPLPFENFFSVLNKHYLKCLTEPLKPFCLLIDDKKLELFRSEQSESLTVEIIESRLKNITSSIQPYRQRIHLLLADFTKLMATIHVKAVLIEPSMLFCLLTPAKRYSLLTRGFNPGRLPGSWNVVTFGIFEKEAKMLVDGNTTNEILSSGFKILKIRNSTWPWPKDESEEFSEVVHLFFIRQEMAVHLVVLYPKETFLWHAGLTSKEIGFGDLLFVNEGVFEQFTSLPLNLYGTSIKGIFPPSDIEYFLKEIESSRFLMCRSESSSTVPAVKHPYLTKEQLRVRVTIALKELKVILAPHIVFFGLWSNTLLGWFNECDILYYSTSLELFLTLRSIKGLNLNNLLSNNEFLKIQNSTISDIVYHLDCHGLLIKIFILREEQNSYWYKRIDGQSAYKFIYHVFKECSTVIFGQKVNIPCSKKVIMSEHKMNWTDTGTDRSFLELEN